jgi:hypothetical protein
MRSLFLKAPSFDGFDAGAGAHYPMKREVRSFWYPTRLAQPAAVVQGSKLIDAPPHRLKFEGIVAPEFKSRERAVAHRSTPSFQSGVKTAKTVGEMIASPEMMKRRLREGVEFFHFLRTRRDTA